MKKTIITALAASGFAMGALAQGSIGSVNNIGTQVVTGVGNQTVAAASAANAWYTGNISLEVFYASTSQVVGSQINAINALNGTSGGGAAALALLNSDGFVVASSSTYHGTTTGAATGAINSGQFNFSSTGSAFNIGLPGAPGSVSASGAWLAFYAVAGVDSGVLAFANATGGNPNATPAGTVAAITGMDGVGSGINKTFDLTPAPEPSSLALAGLGGFGMLMAFRRKKA